MDPPSAVRVSGDLFLLDQKKKVFLKEFSTPKKLQ